MEPPPRLDRSTARGRRRREELLVAAREVFESSGYFDTRVADIASRAGVSHGTFYTYFKSKDDVLRALIKRMVDGTFIASAVSRDSTLTAFEQLEASIAAFMAAYRTSAGMQRILGQVVSFNDDFLAMRLLVRTRFVARIRDSIVSLQARGIGERDLDPLHAAHALGGMVEDCAFACFVLHQDLDEATAVATMTRIWARAVGLSAPAARSSLNRARRQPSTLASRPAGAEPSPL